MRTKEQLILDLSGYDRYHEVLIDSAGTKIALSLYESDKQSPCVVFLPGTMTHPFFYDDFLTLLAQNGFNVAGVHFISHGKSPREKKLYSFADMVQNARDAISYCSDNISKTIILMGSSQGGIVSLTAACEDSRIKAVLPHNVLIPSLASSIYVTNFPRFLKPFTKPLISLMKIAAKVSPAMQVPITFYLDFERISSSQEVKDLFYSDPLGLTSYPLYYLSSLFNADLSKISDGSIKCPVIVIASTGDRLFSYDYTLEVFERIAAPRKEMITFNEPYHLIFNECPEKVIDPIVQKLREYS